MAESKVSIPGGLAKSPQTRVQRLKKQEEEEHWISEEELYTEGSSDEEKSSHPSKWRHRPKSSQPNKKTDEGSSTSVPQVKLLDVDSELAGIKDSNPTPSLYPDHDDISWRPKRGSIKLPNIDITEFASASDGP